MTHGDDFVVTGPTDRLANLKNNMAGVYPIKTKVISFWLNRKHHSAEHKIALEKARSKWCISTISEMLTCSRHILDLNTATQCRLQQYMT